MMSRVMDPPSDVLMAVVRGQLPAVFVPEKDADGKFLWPDHVILQLGGPPLSISLLQGSSRADRRFARRADRRCDDLSDVRLLPHPRSTIVPDEWGRGGEDSERLELVLQQRCHFQVELHDPEEADEVSVLDKDGNLLEISEFLGNGRRDGPRHPLMEGRSNVLAVGDTGMSLLSSAMGNGSERNP